MLPASHCQKTESILVTLNFEGEYNAYDTLAEYGELGKDPVEILTARLLAMLLLWDDMVFGKQHSPRHTDGRKPR